MKKTISYLLTLASLILLGGCASGLDKNATSIDWAQGSVVVMSVDMANEYKPNYNATRLGVVIHGKTPAQRVVTASPVLDSSGTTLLTKQLPPGRYSINRLVGASQNVLIVGGIDFAVKADFNLPPQSVVYLGRVSLVNKERASNDDQSTGGVLPLIDQAVTGFGNGTLQVTLRDDYEKDIANFKRGFPAFQNAEIIRAPLKIMTLERATGSKAPEKVAIASPSGSATTAEAITDSKLYDLDNLPLANERAKESYKDWLNRPLPRAFVVGPKDANGNGRYVGTWGIKPSDTSEATDPLERALARCKKLTGAECKPYAVDTLVVWSANQ